MRETIGRAVMVGMNGLVHLGFLSPLPGLVAFCAAVPRLTPWATIWRRSAAGAAVPRPAPWATVWRRFAAGAVVPRLMPWATIWRRSAAGAGMKDPASPGGA